MNKQNNRYHRTIEVKSVDVNPSIYIDFNKENNKKGSKIKVGDYARISKCTIFFSKRLCSKLVWRRFCDYKRYCFMGMLLVILKVKNLMERFKKKNCKKQIKKSLEYKN